MAKYCPAVDSRHRRRVINACLCAWICSELVVCLLWMQQGPPRTKDPTAAASLADSGVAMRHGLCSVITNHSTYLSVPVCVESFGNQPSFHFIPWNVPSPVRTSSFSATSPLMCMEHNDTEGRWQCKPEKVLDRDLCWSNMTLLATNSSRRVGLSMYADLLKDLTWSKANLLMLVADIAIYPFVSAFGTSFSGPFDTDACVSAFHALACELMMPRCTDDCSVRAPCQSLCTNVTALCGGKDFVKLIERLLPGGNIRTSGDFQRLLSLQPYPDLAVLDAFLRAVVSCPLGEPSLFTCNATELDFFFVPDQKCAHSVAPGSKPLLGSGANCSSVPVAQPARVVEERQGGVPHLANLRFSLLLVFVVCLLLALCAPRRACGRTVPRWLLFRGRPPSALGSDKGLAPVFRVDALRVHVSSSTYHRLMGWEIPFKSALDVCVGVVCLRIALLVRSNDPVEYCVLTLAFGGMGLLFFWSAVVFPLRLREELADGYRQLRADLMGVVLDEEHKWFAVDAHRGRVWVALCSIRVAIGRWHKWYLRRFAFTGTHYHWKQVVLELLETVVQFVTLESSIATLSTTSLSVFACILCVNFCSLPISILSGQSRHRQLLRMGSLLMDSVVDSLYMGYAMVFRDLSRPDALTAISLLLPAFLQFRRMQSFAGYLFWYRAQMLWPAIRTGKETDMPVPIVPPRTLGMFGQIHAMRAAAGELSVTASVATRYNNARASVMGGGLGEEIEMANMLEPSLEVPAEAPDADVVIPPLEHTSSEDSGGDRRSPRAVSVGILPSQQVALPAASRRKTVELSPPSTRDASVASTAGTDSSASAHETVEIGLWDALRHWQRRAALTRAGRALAQDSSGTEAQERSLSGQDSMAVEEDVLSEQSTSLPVLQATRRVRARAHNKDYRTSLVFATAPLTDEEVRRLGAPRDAPATSSLRSVTRRSRKPKASGRRGRCSCWLVLLTASCVVLVAAGLTLLISTLVRVQWQQEECSQKLGEAAWHGMAPKYLFPGGLFRASSCGLGRVQSLRIDGEAGPLTLDGLPLPQLISLSELRITNSAGLTALPSALAQLSGLETLDLQGNPRLEALPAGLHNLNLRVLDVSRTRVAWLDPALFTSLKDGVLRVDETPFSWNVSWVDAGLEDSLPRKFVEVVGKTLRHLRLDGNAFTRFPPSLPQFSALESLSMERCDMRAFPVNLDFVLPRVEHVSVAHNKIGDFSDESLLVVAQWLALQSLDLSHNVIELAPRAFAVLDHLSLNLAYNPISFMEWSGFDVREIPSEVLALTTLTSVNLGSNDLFELPNISRWTRMESLRLDHTRLSVLPGYFDTFTRLRKLVLGYNEFVGTAPRVLCELKGMEDLQLNNNGLQLLPDCLPNLSRLEYLNLRHTNITNLSSLVAMRSLTVIDVKQMRLPCVPRGLNRTNLTILTDKANPGWCPD